VNEDAVRLWLEKADDDLKAARALLEIDDPPNRTDGGDLVVRR